MRLLHGVFGAIGVLAVAALFSGVLASGSTTASAAATRAWCPSSFSWKKARANVGDPIRIKGLVARVFYARSSPGRPTFIDIGAAYPKKSRVTLVIWAEDRVNFPR